MAGCKPSIWKILSAAGALALLLPRLAVGEFGVCPPYSKTFGPDDPPEEVLAFISEINARPGGGTVIFDGGLYERLIDDISITNVVCMRWSGDDSNDPLTQRPVLRTPTQWHIGVVVMRVEPGAILTIDSIGLYTPTALEIPDIFVASGATLFANNGRFGLRILNHGAAYLENSKVWAGIENLGTLKMSAGVIEGVNAGSLNDARGLINRPGAYAFLERVSVRHNSWLEDYTQSADGTGVSNEGVLTLADSMIRDNGDVIPDCLYPPCDCDGVGLANRGVAYVTGSTIAFNEPDGQCGIGIRSREGFVEVSHSIVAENGDADCSGVVTDLGYNVFGDDSCPISEATSIQADPQFLSASEYPRDYVELGAGSPAIDRIPLALCEETDMLGRERTDGDGDGIVACDSGALEYGYVSLPVTVRTTPYWRTVGTLDVSRQAALFVSVFSTADFDATDILFETIEVEGLEQRALRGPALTDANRDGYLDIAVWYRLDRMPTLACGSYDQRFEVMTADGRLVTGQLRFEVVGCAP